MSIHCTPSRHKPAFTIIELIIVIAIIAILAGLLLFAIQKVRQASARTESSNNLRQLGLAIQHCQTALGSLPPGFGYFPGGPGDPSAGGGSAGYGNVFFHLLPFLEQNSLYLGTAKPGNGAAGNAGTLHTPTGPVYPGSATAALPVFFNPSDPSANSGLIRGTDSFAEGWGVGCYAFNAQAFCTVDENGHFLDWYAKPRLPQSFPDGTSTTIVLAEKYAVCGAAGGFYDGVSAWAAAPAPEATPVFAVSIFPIAGSPKGTIPATGPLTKFEVRPEPFRSDNCHYWLPQTARSEGILVGMADGSVRLVASDISTETWWAACTPAGNEQLGDDW